MTETFEYNGKTYRQVTDDEKELINKARNQASKPSNFTILYGGGRSAVAEPITKTFPEMSEAEVNKRAYKVLKSKKGTRKKGSTDFEGGSWSSAFNMMRKISFGKEIPELPLLKSKISTALRPNAVGDDFVTGRLNWSIQGSGAEILSALIVMMHWLVDYYKIDAQFVIAIHDEIAWIAREEHAHLMAVIFQQAHFLTWTLFHYQMELYELPLQRAYFSGVAIDDRVRKSPYEKTITLSNPSGIDEPNGQEYTIKDMIEKGWIEELINGSN